MVILLFSSSPSSHTSLFNLYKYFTIIDEKIGAYFNDKFLKNTITNKLIDEFSKIQLLIDLSTDFQKFNYQ